MRSGDGSSDVCASYLVGREAVALQQTPEVEDGGLIGQRLQQRQLRKLAQRRNLVQRLFHRRIAVAEPLLHQVDAQHRFQRVRATAAPGLGVRRRSEEHTSELQSLMRISYAVFCLKKKTIDKSHYISYTTISSQ